MTSRYRLWTISAALAGVLALLNFTGCSSSQTKTNTASKTAAQPAFTPAQFVAMGVGGEQHNSADWIGKQAVVLNFWGTWCPPCRKEIPELVRLYDEYHDKGLQMVSLAVRDTPDRVADFSSNQNMNWLMLMAENNILSEYNVTVGVPTTIFLDKHGKEVTRFVGAQSFETFKRAADAALAAA